MLEFADIVFLLGLANTKISGILWTSLYLRLLSSYDPFLVLWSLTTFYHLGLHFITLSSSSHLIIKFSCFTILLWVIHKGRVRKKTCFLTLCSQVSAFNQPPLVDVRI